MEKVFLFFKNKKLVFFGGLLIFILIFTFLRGKGKENGYALVKVERGSIISEVLVTGNVVSSKNVDLSFSSSGKIKKIYVKAGGKVKRGDILILQDTSVLESQLLDAKANLKNAEANYLALKRGITKEELELALAQVKNAEVSLQNAKLLMLSTIKDLYSRVDDAIRSDTDNLFESPRLIPKLKILISNPQLQINIEEERTTLEKYFNEWEELNKNLSLDSNFEENVIKTREYLNLSQKFLNYLSEALNEAFPSKEISLQSINNWKIVVANSRAKISSAISTLNNAESNFNSALSNLEVAKRNLNLKKAPPTKEALISAESAIEKAKAQINLIQSQIDQMILKSPVNGIVFEIYPKEGETVLAGQKVISLIGDESLEIEGYVSEVDVAKIKIGNFVSIKLDAFPNETFEGNVSFINAGPTIINNVPQYKIKVAFNKNDERLKSGMTANLTIQTEKKENVLILPQYSILREKDGVFVIKLNKNSNEEKIPVVLGAQDQNGNVEIIEGVKEGEEVLNIGLKKQK